jgi:hypothetical protein
MAVKVMVAPAIASGQLAKPAAARPAPAKEKAAAAPRTKRRRSAVYDADGNEVFITLICLKCQKIRPLSQFGLRKMADGSIRNQPWCRTCRSAPSSRAEAEARGDTAEATAGESPILAESPVSTPSPSPDAAAAPSKARAGAVAAEVAAALWAGRR